MVPTHPISSQRSKGLNSPSLPLRLTSPSNRRRPGGRRRGDGGRKAAGSITVNCIGMPLKPHRGPWSALTLPIEWVEDRWNPSYRSAPNDGSAWTSGDCSLRVLRAGSFGNKAIAVRSSARSRYDEDVRFHANWFRVARDLN